MSDADPARDKLSTAGSLVSATTLFALAHGLTQAQLEVATGHPIGELIAPDARLPATLLPAIWVALLERAPDQALPLKMAAVAPLDYFGPLAFGARYASTLREALENFVRYRQLLSDGLECGLVEAGETGTLWFRHQLDAADRGASAEAGLLLGARFIAEVLALPEALVGVTTGHAPHGPEQTYIEAFGVPVRFEADANALIVRRASLEGRPPAGDPRLFAHISAHLTKVHEELSAHDPLAEIRQAIADNASRSEYAAEALAKRLGVSLRVLQRQVAAEGATVRALLDDAREANARKLLGERRLSVEEVAYLLGYSDERAFRRSFKRLTGQTPAQFRKQRA